jgi:hypothetical protein
VTGLWRCIRHIVCHRASSDRKISFTDIFVRKEMLEMEETSSA